MSRGLVRWLAALAAVSAALGVYDVVVGEWSWAGLNAVFVLANLGLIGLELWHRADEADELLDALEAAALAQERWRAVEGDLLSLGLHPQRLRRRAALIDAVDRLDLRALHAELRRR